MVMAEACDPASLVGEVGRAIPTRVDDRMPAVLPREEFAEVDTD
jgi:hypothetical protein